MSTGAAERHARCGCRPSHFVSLACCLWNGNWARGVIADRPRFPHVYITVVSLNFAIVAPARLCDVNGGSHETNRTESRSSDGAACAAERRQHLLLTFNVLYSLTAQSCGARCMRFAPPSDLFEQNNEEERTGTMDVPAPGQQDPRGQALIAPKNGVQHAEPQRVRVNRTLTCKRYPGGAARITRAAARARRDHEAHRNGEADHRRTSQHVRR